MATKIRLFLQSVVFSITKYEEVSVA